MAKKRARHSVELKREVCDLVLSDQKSVPEVCALYDLVESTVYGWVRQARIDAGDGPDGALTTEELNELRALRKENKELRRERDFLKTAAAYFAKAKQ